MCESRLLRLNYQVQKKREAEREREREGGGRKTEIDLKTERKRYKNRQTDWQRQSMAERGGETDKNRPRERQR